MFKGIFERIEDTERPHDNEPSRFESEARYKFASDYINENTNLILDIGCGEGWGLDFLRKKSRHIVGIDYSKEVIVLAKSKFKNIKNCDFVAMDACCLAFKNRIFDTVCALEILEHLENSKEFFREIKRVLTDKGAFILTSPNKIYWDKLSIIRSPFHINEYSYQELKKELRDYFEVESFLGFFPRFKKIEENLLFKPYMRIKKFLRLEKFQIGGKIRASLFGGSKITDYYLSGKNLENCSHFFVVCRKKDG